MTAEPLILLIAAGAAVSGLIAMESWRAPAARARRALRNAPRVPVRDARDGELVKIAGTIRLEEAPLVAPMSRRRCAFYEVVVEEYVLRSRNSHWERLFTDSERCDFLVEDETGTAGVRTRGATVVPTADASDQSGWFRGAKPDFEAYLTRRGIATVGPAGIKRNFRYREAVLAEGEPVSVRGVARWEPGPEPASQTADYRSPSLRLLIVPPGGSQGPTLISDDPRTLG